jgi:hypothetical protein
MDDTPTRKLAARYARLWEQATDLLHPGWNDGKGPATFAVNDDGEAVCHVGDMLLSEDGEGGYRVLRVTGGQAVLAHVDAHGAVRLDQSPVTDPALN